MSIAHINLIYRLSVLGGSREIYPPRILHRQRLLPAFADSSLPGCGGGGADGYCAQPLSSVALFLLSAAGFCGAGGDLYRANRELLNTSLAHMVIEMISSSTVSRVEIPNNKSQVSNLVKSK